ncbi:hypothetical protein CBL_10813 [Carabus blaptoides fortunei]
MAYLNIRYGLEQSPVNASNDVTLTSKLYPTCTGNIPARNTPGYRSDSCMQQTYNAVISRSQELCRFYVEISMSGKSVVARVDKQKLDAKHRRIPTTFGPQGGRAPPPAPWEHHHHIYAR